MIAALARGSRAGALAVVFTLVMAACGSATSDPSAGDLTEGSVGLDRAIELPAIPAAEPRMFGHAPLIPHGQVSTDVVGALDVLFGDELADGVIAGAEIGALDTLVEAADPRAAWPLFDLLTFLRAPESVDRLTTAAESLVGMHLDPLRPDRDLGDRLLAWNTPAPAGYADYKRALYTLIEPKWAPFFDPGPSSSAGEIDLRAWTWGGVGIDDRPFGADAGACKCIPAVDDPPLTDAAGGAWYADDRVVFGVDINGFARAYPRAAMEVRELANDSLGGRSYALSYCTLCGSAQLYFTDQMPLGVDRPVMRTSGLLNRSNKLMFDVNTFSLFEAFRGTALTGPLAEAGVVLEQGTVVTTTWGEWKADHPHTTIVAEHVMGGRDSDLLNTRDANGPIFPVGEVDPRLPAQEPVLGVVTEAGVSIAFHVNSARAVLEQGGTVRAENVIVTRVAGGLRATDLDGRQLATHEAFWFAWSQFHQDTTLWPGE